MHNLGLLLSFLLTLATAWLAFIRFQTKPDNSWPLLYYFALVGYLNTYDLVLNPYVVYVAVVCALLLRFEFMNDRIIFLVRIIEVGSLMYIGYCLIGAVQKSLP
jgi:hypothetical protein